MVCAHCNGNSIDHDACQGNATRPCGAVCF
jgi:hypothetical protein